MFESVKFRTQLGGFAKIGNAVLVRAKPSFAREFIKLRRRTNQLCRARNYRRERGVFFG